ncbi:MAG: Hsp20/alpha crystallin family protein [Deltaproteobacteria bacterium]|nr:Hsp20/alpha crystallin family protein [Deltaproteobacteria bacterium]MBW1818197.1 Hsp20/alpha crystallin family protein [Deltaproteobacteria bacterium]MBW2285662.1 Hsp20/alpha crystallin family protein [Deltaproteobacteria bacterium]
MFELTHWKDQEMKRLRRDMDRLFDRMFTGFVFSTLPTEFVNLPRLEMTEADDTVTLKAEIPGVDPDQLEVSVTAQTLTIKGRLQAGNEKETPRGTRMERRYGSFSRTIRLPAKVDTDGVDATYRKGVLKIVLVKRRPEGRHGVRVKIKK